MKITNFLLAVAALLAAPNLSYSQWTEDFETDGEGTRYTTSFVFNDGVNDHYGRTDGTDISGSYMGQSGLFFWAGEDLDDDGGDALINKTITFNTIDVTGQTEVTFTGSFATGQPLDGWDAADVLRVEYSFDAGVTWSTLMEFGSNAAGSNGGLHYDPDPSDGLFATGPALTQTFQPFASSISVTSNALELRVYAECNSSSEEFAFDLLGVVNGGGTPGCTDPAADNYDPAATSDDGSCIISGCTDMAANNYNPDANTDDGSCFFLNVDLVINEIHYNPCGTQGVDTDFEFLEIYNAGTESVDLVDYSFTGIDFTFPIASSIAAGEYIIVTVAAINYTGNGYQVFEWTTGSLGNSGELVELLDPLFNVIDAVSYLTSAPWPTEPNGQCSSLELIAVGLDNSLPENWQGSYDDNGTPGATNSQPTAGCTNPDATNYDPAADIDDGSCIVLGCTDMTALNFNPAATQEDGSCIYTLPNIVINELHYNPCFDQGDDADWEFIELYNAELASVDLSNYTFTSGVVYTFPNGSAIGPGEYVIIAINALNYEGNGYQVFQWDANALSSNGELVQLSNSFGNVIDEVTYSDILPWPEAANGLCSSLELIDPSLDNTLPESWQASYVPNGTPGAENSTPPEGCTSPDAVNYDPIAVVDDGTCIFEGCTDVDADNYDAMANSDDGSCIYLGCTYEEATNYDAMANLDDSSCEFMAGPSCPGDLNGDGNVNGSDLVLLLANFGGVCN